ncbi:tripartite tricarboxylate transporter substrate-binding protein [Oricola sp.]|uniref:Bug family tripartite tricarboxylate transporter substrate binding protein n=1 Tax=Oricola sp. TaxID=1979950 RepID=UPI0025D809EC|nr:tripartite tricarboxylate transporter substrate-binding protein [Oricola sp.]MCI5077433.1 hypothetical protein [Oricola sp.]
MTTRIKKIGLAASLALAVLGVSQPYAAPFDADTVELRIGYSAGGGYDTFGRLVARHLGRFLPGNPDFVVQNQPGGGSLKLTLLTAASKANDGSLITMANSSMATFPLFNADAAKYDPTALTWIGSLANETSVCVTTKASGIETMDAFMAQDFVVGATDKGATTYQFPALLKNLFDAKFRIVTGYPGGPEILLAMEQGEVQARCGYSWSSLKGSAYENQFNRIGQLGLVRNKDLGDLPAFYEMIEDENERKAAALVIAPLAFYRAFFAPPGMDPEVAATLRDAFTEMTQDAEFLKEAESLGLDVDAMPGEEIQKLVAELMASDASLVERAGELLE